MDAEYERLVVPGRFQPPHVGHLKTIEYALKVSKSIIIVVGSAQESYTVRNPLTAGERIELLTTLMENELGELAEGRYMIVPVLDINSHKMWVQYLRMLLPRFDGVVSGNPLVRMLFEDMGLAALSPPMYRREKCSGTIIRNRILEGDDEWLECIPGSIRDRLMELGFDKRIRELANEV